MLTPRTDDPERTLVRRETVRVLPITEDGQVLLICGINPSRPDEPFWFSIGGAMEGEEAPRDAAVRELFEEVGIQADPTSLIGPTTVGDVTFDWGTSTISQSMQFYVLPLESGPVPITFEHQEAVEQDTITTAGWWTLPALLETDETLPDGLVDHVSSGLAAWADYSSR